MEFEESAQKLAYFEMNVCKVAALLDFLYRQWAAGRSVTIW
ncbi:conserved hypothetical protein [Histoplasma capsulatum H143]|uniref:Uncharacterized protein n=1 Tax=Ajellomyces capsulatus (strain H143) TaxID=544712 RepID=C6HGG4_AJECH|nr:conserved hypothetical protein [Histoplasma capsulatum H143]